jgi:hypothetical protein
VIFSHIGNDGMTSKAPPEITLNPTSPYRDGRTWANLSAHLASQPGDSEIHI